MPVLVRIVFLVGRLIRRRSIGFVGQTVWCVWLFVVRCRLDSTRMRKWKC